MGRFVKGILRPNLVTVDRDTLVTDSIDATIVVDVVPNVPFVGIFSREVNVHLADTLLRNGMDQELIAEEILIVDGKRLFVLRILRQQWTHHRQSEAFVLVEQCVPVGEVGVPLANGIADHQFCVLREQPRFAPFCVDVSMRPEERLECTWGKRERP